MFYFSIICFLESLDFSNRKFWPGLFKIANALNASHFASICADHNWTNLPIIVVSQATVVIHTNICACLTLKLA